MAARKKRTPRKPRTKAHDVSELNKAPEFYTRTESIEIPGTGIEMERRVGDVEDVPKMMPFVFNQDQVRDVSIGIKLGLNILLTGPTGCGKTRLVIALAAHLNQPLIRFNFDGETRKSHLVGQMRPASKDGVLTLEMVRGALVVALERGMWVLGDEIDMMLPGVAGAMQSVLEEGNRSLYIPETGERIEAHPYFQFFATGNTLGYRSTARAKHAGTNPVNDAFLDRFGMVIACDYPTLDEEVERIKVNCPHVEKMYVAAIAKCAADLRTDEKFKSDFSTRRCVQWARLCQEYHPDPQAIVRAFDLAVGRKFTSPTDAKVAKETLLRLTGYKKGG